MRIWVKLIACFLIAWLPLLGYPAQATLCPEMSSMANRHQHANAMHPTATAGCMQDGKHQSANAQPTCHGDMGGTVCGMAALPVTHAVIAVPFSRVYRAIAQAPSKQFIPELPAPPPRSL
ncbi:hypothetical protein J4763_07060 [Burkholderia pseudomallei]|uniref:hypothetical protein n=1 Tax=Burkholderia pseudomallei TaxID=28450 RepID=UPI001AAEA040|nr:hypothetical protein [Burkholderia pseudomallei]MBO3056548.1 hypothetical protein [Burkholderia pseudomallei]